MFTHRTFYQDRKKVFTDPGSRTKPEYSARYDETGVLVLDEVGVVDVYADIQSYLDSVEIHALIRRFKNGEVDVLEKVQGFYADVSDLPKTNLEFLNRVLESQEFFAGLPPEIREVYGNDYARFIADFDTRAVMSALSPSDNLAEVKESDDVEVKTKNSTRSTRKSKAKVDASESVGEDES